VSIWPLVRRLEREGFRFVLDAGRLQVGPASRLNPVDRQALQAHRTELIQALEDDARYLAEERAGIFEYDAGLPRDEAERRAGLR
jgi:hypothetical protein